MGHSDLIIRGWEAGKDRARRGFPPAHIFLSRSSLGGISGQNTRKTEDPTSARLGAHKLANVKQRAMQAGRAQ